MEKARENQQDNRWITILSTILAISVAFNIILYYKGSDLFPKREELLLENTKLSKQVQNYKSVIKKYSGISTNIDKVVADATLKLEEKEREIQSLKRELRINERENAILLSQIDSLQDKYLNVIDSLLVEREATKVINRKLEFLTEEIDSLNSRIKLAGTLIGDNLSVTPLKTNRSGKTQPSAMIKRCQK